MVSFHHIVKKRGLPDSHAKIILADLERKGLISLDVDYRKLGSTIDHHKYILDELRIKGKITNNGIEKCKAEIKWKVPIFISIIALLYTITHNFISGYNKDERMKDMELRIYKLDSTLRNSGGINN